MKCLEYKPGYMSLVDICPKMGNFLFLTYVIEQCQQTEVYIDIIFLLQWYKIYLVTPARSYPIFTKSVNQGNIKYI